MFGWLKELLELKVEYRRENHVCDSCETLKTQLNIANFNNEQLMRKILKEPEPIVNEQPPVITRPAAVPWQVRRQMLMAEDREKAKLIRNAPKPDSIVKETTEDLEKELGVVEAERNAESTSQS